MWIGGADPREMFLGLLSFSPSEQAHDTLATSCLDGKVWGRYQGLFSIGITMCTTLLSEEWALLRRVSIMYLHKNRPRKDQSFANRSTGKKQS